MDAYSVYIINLKGKTKGGASKNLHGEDLAVSMILLAFGSGRVACLVINGSYRTVVGIVISLALMVFK